MATTINAGSLFLAAASPRLLTQPNSAILVSTTAPMFHVNTSGTPDTTSVLITAQLISLSGTVTFSITGGTLSSISGNTAVLTYANMSANLATITATLVYRGNTFTSTTNISKVFDGATGSTGTAGSRGAGTYYATGSAWDDTVANIATPGSNVTDDLVTISNGSTYALTKRWDGSAWVSIGTVIDGNLLVTGSVGAVKINANGLSIRKADGTLILDASGSGLQTGFEAPGTKNSDIIVGGLNLYPDSSFERGTHPFTSRNVISTLIVGNVAGVGTLGGSKALYMDTSGGDMYVYPDGPLATVVAGHKYMVSFFIKTATVGSITNSSTYLVDSAGTHTLIPLAGLPNQATWTRYVTAWTCPTGVTTLQVRFGIVCTGTSWMAVDCVQIEEGNAATQWSPAPEDIAADTALAQAAANTANSAINDATTGLAQRMRANADNVLGGIISANAVSAPAGFRAGTLTWDASGTRTGGYGVAITPKGLVGYTSAGVQTFIIDATTGGATFAGTLNVQSATSGARTEIVGDVIRVYDTSNVLRVKIGNLA